ncbi:hypothetical protein STEG23_018777 [Scotinomys teguina]
MHAFCLAETALDDCGPGVTLLKLYCFTEVPGLLEGYQSIESDTEVVAQTPLQGNSEGLLQSQLLEKQGDTVSGVGSLSETVRHRGPTQWTRGTHGVDTGDPRSGCGGSSEWMWGTLGVDAGDRRSGHGGPTEWTWRTDRVDTGDPQSGNGGPMGQL